MLAKGTYYKSTLGSAPTVVAGNTGNSSNMILLGQVINPTYTGSTGTFNTTGVPISYSSATIQQNGVYLVTYTALCNISSTANINSATAYVSTGNGIFYGYQSQNNMSNTAATIAFTSSFMYVVTSPVTMVLYVGIYYSTGSIQAVPNSFQYAITRIA
jgi:hypothetical protein